MVLLLREANYGKFHRWTSLPRSLSSWLCFQLFLHLVLIQSGMLVVVMGLNLETVFVPPAARKGSSAILSCEFQVDGGGEKLYSLKWYKDSHEFFRYMPQSPNPILTFKQPGVQVDTNQHGSTLTNKVVLTLRNLRLSSAGTYKCEISADAPTFKTLSKESNLSVYVIPESAKPRLKSFPKESYLGERVRGNCSFSESHPAAKLTFFVNGAKVNNSEDNVKVTTYEPQVDGVVEDNNRAGGSSIVGGSSYSTGIGREYQYQQQNQQISSSNQGRDGVSGSGSMQLGGIGNAPTTDDKTYMSVSGIEFRLDRQLRFLQRGQVLNIRCVATVADKIMEAQTNITILKNFQPPKLSSTGQNRYASGSVIPIFASQTARLGLLAITWIILSC